VSVTWRLCQTHQSPAAPRAAGTGQALSASAEALRAAGLRLALADLAAPSSLGRLAHAVIYHWR